MTASELLTRLERRKEIMSDPWGAPEDLPSFDRALLLDALDDALALAELIDMESRLGWNDDGRYDALRTIAATMRKEP